MPFLIWEMGVGVLVLSEIVSQLLNAIVWSFDWDGVYNSMVAMERLK